MRRHTTAEFVSAWKACGGSPAKVSRVLGVAIANVMKRRARLSDKGIHLQTIPADGHRPNRNPEGWQIEGHAYSPRIEAEVKEAVVVVANDCHYWPNHIPTAHTALCIVLKQVKPSIVCMDGDVFDGANISRHEPLGWQKLPTVMQELDACKARLWEIEKAAPQARKVWTVGNHDSRFDRRLATEISEFEEVPGMRLSDHFKAWEMSYSLMLNEDLDEPVMVKHAFKGGAHAVYNNTLHAGVSIVTGHLHAQLCRPFTDYRGTRYGVDTGCIADIDGGQFSYTLDAPVNWRSGFAVLTFDEKGRLLPPELCEVQRYRDARRAIFRGRVIHEEKA